MFTESEIRFFAIQNFALDDVHDGRGQSKSTRAELAKQAGKILILTSVRCRSGGHRIRTRAGHCAQCNPAVIAFTQRESAQGYVYIAGSMTGRLIKVGTAKDIAQRHKQLRAERYGGFKDWEILLHVHLTEAGRIEREVSDRLSGSRINLPYVKDGYGQTATELFRCGFSQAFDALSASIGSVGKPERWLNQNQRYEFD